MAFYYHFILFSLRYRINGMIYIMLSQGHICEITLSYVYLDYTPAMRIFKDIFDGVYEFIRNIH